MAVHLTPLTSASASFAGRREGLPGIVVGEGGRGVGRRGLLGLLLVLEGRQCRLHLLELSLEVADDLLKFRDLWATFGGPFLSFTGGVALRTPSAGGSLGKHG